MLEPIIIFPKQGAYRMSMKDSLTSFKEEVSSKLDALISEADAGTSETPVETPVDTTPYSQADVDAAVARAEETLKAEIDSLKLQIDQADADKLQESVAAKLRELAQELSDMTQGKGEEPQPEPQA